MPKCAGSPRRRAAHVTPLDSSTERREFFGEELLGALHRPGCMTGTAAARPYLRGRRKCSRRPGGFAKVASREVAVRVGVSSA